jgi:ankyrin repeat protein
MKYIKTYENNNLEDHLINSIKSGRLYKVKELIEKKGVDKNFKDRNSSTPLMLAIILEKKDIVKYLLSINVDLNIQDYRGNTALMLAAMHSLQNFDSLCDLIDAGADWFLENKSKENFLDFMLFKHLKDRLINKYPDKYENYLLKKEADKYNL